MLEFELHIDAAISLSLAIMKILNNLSALGLVMLLASCASNVLPPKLTKAESAVIRESPMPYSVGVEDFKYPVYSQSLMQALKDCGAFEEVRPLAEFNRRPDYIATVEETVHGRAVIPALTLVSLGLIPTVAEERHGFRFALAPATRPKDKKHIDATYRGMTTLGWAAIPINMTPNYTSDDPDSSERLHQMLAYKVISTLRQR